MRSKKFGCRDTSVRLFCGLSQGQPIKKTWGGSEEARNKHVHKKKKKILKNQINKKQNKIKKTYKKPNTKINEYI